MQATLPLCILAASLALGATAQARTGRADPAERLAQADTNHDGRITRDEFLAGRAQRFAKADRNGDGFISDDDLPPFARSNPGMLQKVHALQHAADLDGDGRIARAEFEQAGERLFVAADGNRDGVIDQAEVNQAMARVQALAGK